MMGANLSAANEQPARIVQAAPHGGVPSGAFLPEAKKTRMHVARCTFCAQCVDACPVDALAESPDFLLSDTDRSSAALTVE